MTQILEEKETSRLVNISLAIIGNVQFLLRVGYVNNYPEPVSLRHPIDWFVKKFDCPFSIIIL